MRYPSFAISLCRKVVLPALLLSVAPLSAQTDILAQYQAMNPTLYKVLPEARALTNNGDMDAGNQKLLDAFPEATRTPAQSFILGNLLYDLDPKLSYSLHKLAAAKLPDEPDVQFEWALEEHRAGEYAAAADTYAKYVKARPDAAPVWGLLAECLIRTQQISAAVDAWLQHEKAKTGTVQEFETLVGDVHTPIPANELRLRLLAKAKGGDIDAMEKLALTDTDFKQDWWHGGPVVSLLQKDFEILGNTPFTDPSRVNEIKAVVEFTLVAEALDDEEKVTAALRKYGLLLDDKATLPQSGAVLSALMSTLLDTQILSAKEAREKFGPAILARARATHDAETYNVAAHLYLDTPQLADIDQEGWDATQDVRFAASRIVGLNHDGKLAYDDPLLVKAAKQFPENAEIAKVVVDLTMKAGQPDQAAIIQAIEAEYTHFSLNGSPSRISSEALRGYFELLGKELKNTPQP